MFEPLAGTLTWGAEQRSEGRWTMIAAATVDRVGLGFAPFGDIGRHPGQFHALAFASRPARVARQLPRLYAGGAPRPPDRGGRPASLDLETVAPFTLAIDGDLYPHQTAMNLRAGPILSVLVPTA